MFTVRIEDMRNDTVKIARFPELTRDQCIAKLAGSIMCEVDYLLCEESAFDEAYEDIAGVSLHIRQDQAIIRIHSREGGWAARRIAGSLFAA